MGRMLRSGLAPSGEVGLHLRGEVGLVSEF